jgi:N-acetylglucosamine-6-sulfatase
LTSLALLAAVGVGLLIFGGRAISHRLDRSPGQGTTRTSTVPSDAASAPDAKTPAAAPDAPNIIVIQSDDQSLAETSRATMPRTFHLLGDEGTTFRNYIVTTPDCCPSRASLMTGQYAHNHGVSSNGIGYPALRDKSNTLPVWLQSAGYRTAHLGKFMNKYNEVASPPSAPAPGWDRWISYAGADDEDKGYGYYSYRLSIDGQVRYFDTQPRDYLGRVLDDWAVRTVDRYLPDDAPLYMQLDLKAPHAGRDFLKGRCSGAGVPDPRDYGLIGRVRFPRPPSFDEARVADKPPWVQGLQPLRGAERRELKRNYACAVASLRGVDRTVADVYRAVKRAGELDRTIIVFTSDNGLLQGEHRLAAVKQHPYEEAFRVPMLMRVPGGAAPSVVTAPTANIDLAPTFLALAGATPCNDGGCRTMDGRSLMPLLGGEGKPFPVGRRLLVEFDLERNHTHHGVCAFSALWTPRRLFVVDRQAVLDSRTRLCEPVHMAEDYDLRRDPYALHNLAADPDRRERRRIHRLSAALRGLRNCAGSGLEASEVVTRRPLCE